MATSEEWAWLAGLFEGEGTAVYNKRALGGQVIIKMTDRDVLEQAERIFPTANGVKPANLKNRPEHYKPQYTWMVLRQSEIIKFFDGVMPWLSARRTGQARALLSQCHPGVTKGRKDHIVA